MSTEIKLSVFIAVINNEYVSCLSGKSMAGFALLVHVNFP